MSSYTTEDYNGTSSQILGMVQIVCGVVSMVVHVIGLLVTIGYVEFMYASLTVVSYGLWCGFFFFLAGVFALVAGVYKSRGWIVTNLVFSFLASVFAGILVMCALTTVILLSTDADKLYDTRAFTDDATRVHRHNSVLAMGCILLIFAITEMAAAIWTCIVCCKVTCHRFK